MSYVLYMILDETYLSLAFHMSVRRLSVWVGFDRVNTKREFTNIYHKAHFGYPYNQGRLLKRLIPKQNLR